MVENFRPDCKFFFDSLKKSDYVYETRRLKKEKRIIDDADRVCRHVFNLLSSGDLILGDKIEWNKDYKTGFVWKNEYSKNIEIIDLNNNADVKFPWEVSRMQHVFVLGKAFWITNNKKYLYEFKNEMDEWINENPYLESVNWTCSMEAAIRALNMISGYYFFNDYIDDKGFWNKYFDILYKHGTFIYENPEGDSARSNNHYLSDLMGLVFLGIFFKNDKWLNFGLSELEKEIRLETEEDGTDFESSTSYQRLVIEIYLYVLVICEKNNITVSDEYKKILEKMCEFLSDIVKPDGSIPFTGDEDDGRIMIFSDYYNWNKKSADYVLSVAARYFKRNDFYVPSSEYTEDVLWCLGEMDGINPKSKSYNIGGYYLLRNESIYTLIRGGCQKIRGDGHAHNDALSFELNVCGKDFVVDPGTFAYTFDYKSRNLFRSTKMHNTLVVEGFEQNDFKPDDLFCTLEHNETVCDDFCENLFEGSFHGYEKKLGIVHGRKFCIEGSKLVISDKISGNIKNQDEMYMNFILDPEVQVIKGENYIFLKNGDVELIFKTDKFKNVVLCKSKVSHGYGHVQETNAIKIYLNDEMLKSSFELYMGV